MTRNLTIAMDDEKLAQLRVYAAEKRTTVNALFRKHTDDLLDGDDRRQASRARIRQLMDENIARDAEKAAARARGEHVEEETWRWSREDTYSGPRFDISARR